MKKKEQNSAISGAPASASSTPVNSPASAPAPPKLARRNLNRHSTLRSGRTIGEKRERLETASERTAAHRKIKQKHLIKMCLAAAGFLVVLVAIIGLAQLLMDGTRGSGEVPAPSADNSAVSYIPTIEIIDEDRGGIATGANLTSRMREYIGQVEHSFREAGLTPVRAVIPTGAIREVDFYLDSYTGRFKMITDRGAGVSVEDAVRMLKYLTEHEISDFEYIDVRLDGKAYWK